MTILWRACAWPTESGHHKTSIYLLRCQRPVRTIDLKLQDNERAPLQDGQGDANEDSHEGRLAKHIGATLATRLYTLMSSMPGIEANGGQEGAGTERY